jgi:DNA recombination protein RmuC
MEGVFTLGIGVVLGAAIVLVINHLRRREASRLAQELIAQTDKQKIQDLESLIARIREAFGALSLEALSKNTDEFLKLAKESFSKQAELGQLQLEGKKQLIDQTLELMKTDLQKVQTLISSLEKDREQKFGEISSQLKTTAEQTESLRHTADQLKSALASRTVRGQWGQRMAEDVLRLAGFVEGVNYLKQKSLEAGSGTPDYTFLLPQNLKVNMDVKFPLDNYLKYVDADADADKQEYKKRFLQDVKARIKEVTGGDYINPADNTVDYVIVFIPNEQVYGFLNDADRSLLDDALKQKVIVCSPLTLYAILAIIRQAVDNFNLERTAAEILSLLGAFNKQWGAFVSALEKMGRRIEDAQKEYETLTGTRRRKLERALGKIEDLRKQKGIPADASLPDEEELNDVDYTVSDDHTGPQDQ